MSPARRPTRILVACGAALAIGLAGCGGGGSDTGGATTDLDGADDAGTSTTTTAAPQPVASFRTLANAVCRAEVAAVPRVPEVPRTQADAETRRYASETRRYVAAVERAADGLANAFVLLERRRPESQDALGPLVTKARAVVRAAGGTDDGGGAAASTDDGGGAAANTDRSSATDGIEDELRVTIAVLNEATSAAGLPTCSL